MSETSGPAKRNLRFRPSSASRWLACWGSVALCAKLPDDSGGNAAARRGTAIHFMAEKALKNETLPIEWLDRAIPVESHQIFVDEAMVESAQLYVDYVESRAATGATLEIEKRLSLEPLDPEDPLLKECQGTSDVVLHWSTEKMVEIVDLKSGRGYVSAKTLQGLLYGLMELLALVGKHDVNALIVTIVQPSDLDENDRIRSHAYTVQEVWDFVGTVYQAMHGASQPNPPLTPGEEQCRWCPAGQEGICPALANEALNVARGVFQSVPLVTAVTPVPPPGPMPFLPDPALASGEELSAWLKRRDLVEAWFTGVEQAAVRFLQAGIAVPDFKLKARTGNRKFKDVETAPAALRALGVQTSAMYAPPRLLTPAQIENNPALGKNKEARKAALAPLVDRADNGVALVRETAKGDAVPGVFGPVPAHLLEAPKTV